MKKILLLLFIFSFYTVAAQKKQPYKIIAYYTGNGNTIKQYPVDKLTHIIYSFLKLQNDTLTFKDSVQQSTVQQLVALKQMHPQLKIIVSIGGWGGCAPCSGLFASATHRENFAKTTVALFKQYGIDGLDLDWEYPVIEGYPSHKYDAADKDNFTALITALRKEMGTAYLLSFAAGGFTQYLQHSVDWAAVTPLVDFINLMTYDLVSGFATVTGHHTPLYSYTGSQQSAATCVNWLTGKQVPAGKLIMGAAMYARVWQNVADTNHGLYQPGTFKQTVPYSGFGSYFSDTSGFTHYWDKKSRSSYQYNATQQLFATFDDSRSIKQKIKFIRRKKMGGIMFWQLLDDLKEGGLVEEMWKGLGR